MATAIEEVGVDALRSFQKSNATVQATEFFNVPQAAEDPMFGLSAAYRRDTYAGKIDLGVGAYRDDMAKPWVLPVVKKAEDDLRQNSELNHEYLPIAGLYEYLEASKRLVFGNDSQAIKEQRVISLQTLSGTGALHLGSQFLSRFFKDSPAKRVYVSTPAYANHLPILNHVSLQTGNYPYYDPSTKSLDLHGMISKLQTIPNGSIVLLHACAHNPTGVDPDREQWKKIATVMKAKRQLPFFDSAYQGFASGDLDNDVWPIRHFVEQNFEVVMIAQSYAKNFGLYGERAGCLHLVAADADMAKRSLSQITMLHRVINSTPPAYGARIVSSILNDQALFGQWIDDLQTMSGRIKGMRAALRTRLEIIGAPGTWSHITDQVGMFCYTGMSEAQVQRLRQQDHIYMTKDGRISVAGLNTNNVNTVAAAFKQVMGWQEANL